MSLDSTFAKPASASIAAPGGLGVLLDVAGCLDVHHQEGPARPQRPVDVAQHRRRTRLVVDCVESRHRVEARLDVQACHINDLEAGFRQSQPFRLAAGGTDGSLGEVVAGEPAGGESLGHEVDRVAAAGADVGDVDPGLQPFRQTGYHGRITSSSAASFTAALVSAVFLWKWG